MKKKGRGLSYDDKRQKMIKIFHTSQTVFNFEEIEKLSIKAGIPFPSVKQILNSLKADSMVQCEKIGAGVFYWAFPSKAFQIFKSRIQGSQKQIAAFKTQNQKLQTEMKQAEIGREETEERLDIIQQINSLQREKNELQTQIEKYIRFDPERVDALKKQNQEKKKQINLWTDNLQQFKKYVKKVNVGIKNEQICEQYDIPIDLDYVQ